MSVEDKILRVLSPFAVYLTRWMTWQSLAKKRTSDASRLSWHLYARRMRISRSTELKDGAHIRIYTKPKGGDVSDVFLKDTVGTTVDIL